MDESHASSWMIGPYELRVRHSVIARGDRKWKLNGTELSLLLYIVENYNKKYTGKDILDHAWGDDVHLSLDAMRKAMGRLRSILRNGNKLSRKTGFFDGEKLISNKFFRLQVDPVTLPIATAPQISSAPDDALDLHRLSSLVVSKDLALEDAMRNIDELQEKHSKLKYELELLSTADVEATHALNLVEAEDFHEAGLVLNGLLERHAGEIHHRVLFVRGNLHEFESNYAEAAKCYGGAFEICPSSPEYAEKYAYALFYATEYEASEREYDRAIKLFEQRASRSDTYLASYADVLTQSAVACRKNGNYAGALNRLISAEAACRRLPLDSVDGSNRLALVLTTLSALYVTVGRIRDAEPIIREAVDIRERLYTGIETASHVAGRTLLSLRNRSALIRSYAGSINVLAGFLYSSGQYSDAEALYIRVRDILSPFLSNRGDDDSRHQREAICFYTRASLGLGTLYNRLGKSAAAESKYLEILTLLRSRSANDNQLRSLMAGALRCLGELHCENEQLKEAEGELKDAVTVLRDLNQCSPSEYKDDLVWALVALADIFKDVERTTEANGVFLEAIAEARIAANDAPMHEGQLAYVLHRTGRFYMDERRFREAEVILEECLKLRRLIAQRSNGYLGGLAATLNTVGNLYSRTERGQLAKSALEESTTIYRGLAAKAPGVFRIELVSVVSDLADAYCDQAQYARAEELLAETLELCRQLLKEGHRRAETETAYSLRVLGRVYRDKEEWELASKAHAEAIAIYRKMQRNGEKWVESHIAGQLDHLGWAYQGMQRFVEAEKVHRTSLKMYRSLNASCKEYDDDIAIVLDRLGVLYQRTGRWSKAQEALEEACTFWRRLAEKGRKGDLEEFGTALHDRGTLFDAIGDPDLALMSLREALEIRQRLAVGSEAPYRSRVADTLEAIAVASSRRMKKGEGRAAMKQALVIRRALARENPDAYNKKLANSIKAARNLM